MPDASREGQSGGLTEAMTSAIWRISSIGRRDEVGGKDWGGRAAVGRKIQRRSAKSTSLR